MANRTATQTPRRGGALGEREGRLYRATFEDGLLDLFAGATVTLIGLAWLLDQAAFGGIAPAILIPFWPWAKRKLTEPRLGLIHFLPKRDAVERRKMGGFFALGIIALCAGIGIYLIARARGVFAGAELVAGLPAALLALPAVIAGAVYALPRFFAYAFVLLLAGGLVVAFDREPGWALLSAGGFIFLAGVWLVARFARTHPVIDNHACD